jgi:hypothetical protein
MGNIRNEDLKKEMTLQEYKIAVFSPATTTKTKCAVS